MFGLMVFTFGFAGFSRFMPTATLDNSPFYSFRFFCGGLLFVFAFYFLHIILGFGLVTSAWVVMAISFAGWILILQGYLGLPFHTLHQWVHPIPILVIFGALSILINGGIDYLPYSGDEFSNWIGVSRHIFLAGDYRTISGEIYLPNYTPGWRLMLLYPWVLLGSINEGHSAAAPYVMMIGLSGIVYDIARWRLRLLQEISERLLSIYAWGLVLVALAIQIAGPTWMWNLLIEQPQIYTLAVSAMAISLIPFSRSNLPVLLFYAGISLAGSYLLKSAALVFIPPIGITILYIASTTGGTLVDVCRRIAIFAAIVFGPIAICMMTWKLFTLSLPSNTTSIFTLLSAGTFELALSRDWQDLAGRYFGAIWSYFITYKLPLTAGSLFALFFAAARGRRAPLILWGSFFTLYSLILYWYHLSVFGDYSFNNLNSIERFYRVPIQTLHVLGFVVAIIEFSEIIARRQLTGAIPFLLRRSTTILVIIVVITLSAFQFTRIMRSVEDVSTRIYQGVDQNLKKAERAVAVTRRLSGGILSENPKVLLISQGSSRQPIDYADYFARGLRTDAGRALKIKFDGVSWTGGIPINEWQQKVTKLDMRAKLLSNDMIWPLNVDPWIISILTPLVDNSECLTKPLDHYFLIRHQNNSATPLKCVPKTQ